MAEESTITGAPVKLVEHVEQLGTLIGLTSGALLILSVFYDFSFLLALDLTFEDVPTTISDHVRSAIVWAPRVGGMMLAFYMYDMFMRRVEGGRTEKEIIASSSTPKFTKALRAGANALIPLMAGLFLMGFALFVPSLG